MPNYVYTQSADLRVIMQQKLPVLTANDPIFTDIMPIGQSKTEIILWEQRDNYQGLLSPRQYNGGFGRVQREGINRFKVQPGKYGDQKIMDEEFITASRQIGKFGDAFDVQDQQARDQDHLLTLGFQRLKKVGWDLVTSGTYSVLDANGVQLVTDTFSTQTFTASVAWSNLSTATPLADARAIKLKHRGYSVRFNRRAKWYMNSTQVNYALMNTNSADLGGKRQISSTGQAQPLSLDVLNQIFFDNDLPMIVEYDDGYLDSTGTNQLFIADGKGVVIGEREDGSPVAEFLMTPNANNFHPDVVGFTEGMPNIYYDFEFKKNPIRGISTLAFNGAPAVYFGSAIVRTDI